MQEKEKLLVISNASTPASGPRGIQVQRLLVELAKTYRIYLITSVRSLSYRDNNFDDLEIDLFPVKETNARILQLGRKIWSFLSVFDFMFFIRSYNNGKKIIENEDIKKIFAISVGYSNVLCGVELKKKFRDRKMKLYSFYSDPISNNPYRNSTFISKILVRKIERKLICFSDVNICPSKKMCEYFAKSYNDKLINITHIPHAYSTIRKDERQLNLNDGLIIRYLGTMNGDRNPFHLIDLVNQDIDFYLKNKVKFEFYGRYSAALKKQLKSSNHPLFTFYDKIEYNKTIELSLNADALLVIDANFKESVFLPSKLIEIMAFSRPIIVLTSINSESDSVGKKTNSHVLHYNEKNKLKEIIVSLKKNTDSHDYSFYDVENIAKLYIEIFKS